MAVLKCKMCGGDLNIEAGMTVAECEYCGSKQTVPSVDDEKKLKLYERAGKLLRNCEFDKAAGVFESIVAEYSEESEAYWGLVLCSYGIEYVDDPATGKKIPTCHRSSFESVMDNSNFELALEDADSIARAIYREEAKQIEELRKGIIEVSSKEDPYDIFICYKETDEKGDRTIDSVIAQDVYDALTDKGYRVFFSRITLEDKLGQEYEPYIFAALNSAKVMLAFGTDYEYYNTVWVKNEWSRFLQLMTKDKSKHLIPCYKGIDAYDMPKEFAKLQAQDMGKVGAVQDLLRGIEKLLPRETQKEVVKETVVMGAAANTAPLLKRAFMFLEEGKWKEADEYCERVLDIDPENAEAYFGKLMAELQLSKKENLANCEDTFEESDNYQKAVRFGSAELAAEMKGYIAQINKRKENARLERERQAEIRRKQTEEKAKRTKKKVKIAIPVICVIIIALVIVWNSVIVLNRQYSDAIALMDAQQYTEAFAAFEAMNDYKDSSTKQQECAEQIYNNAITLRNSGEYTDAIQAFSSLGDYKDANEQLAKTKQIEQEQVYFEQGKSCMASGSYGEAAEYFALAGKTELMRSAYYTHGKSLYDNDDYIRAAEAFKSAESHGNSEYYLDLCQKFIENPLTQSDLQGRWIETYTGDVKSTTGNWFNFSGNTVASQYITPTTFTIRGNTIAIKRGNTTQNYKGYITGNTLYLIIESGNHTTSNDLICVRQ